MRVRDLVDYLGSCDEDADVKIALDDSLYDVEIAVSSTLNVILTTEGGNVRCMVCGKPAVAASFAKRLVCYEHWNNFKEV